MSYSITSSLIAASSHINTKRFDIDLDVLNDSGQICFLDVQLFKTCWRTNFFKPLLKRSDAVVAVKKWLKPERVKLPLLTCRPVRKYCRLRHPSPASA
ncbi:hypothetical protein WJF71_000595 [Klebsiella pneumoniae]